MEGMEGVTAMKFQILDPQTVGDPARAAVSPASASIGESRGLRPRLGWLAAALLAAVGSTLMLLSGSVTMSGLAAQEDIERIDLDRTEEHDRIPNPDPFQAYPVFHPKVAVPQPGDVGVPGLAGIDVDSRNIVSIVYEVLQVAIISDPGPIGPPGDGDGGGDVIVASFKTEGDLKLPADGSEFTTTLIGDTGALCSAQVKACRMDGKHVWKVKPSRKLPRAEGKRRTWRMAFPDSNGSGEAGPASVRVTVAVDDIEDPGDGGGGGTPFIVVLSGKIMYTNDRHETRRANGFAESFQVSHFSEVFAEAPDVAVWSGPDEVHVVWDSVRPGVAGGFMLRYRRFDRNSKTWIDPIDLEPGCCPNVEVRAEDGTVHVAFIRLEGEAAQVRWLSSFGTNRARPVNTMDFLPSERVSDDRAAALVQKPRLAVDRNGTPHVGWVDIGAQRITGIDDRYSDKTGTGAPRIVKRDSPGPGLPKFLYDIRVRPWGADNILVSDVFPAFACVFGRPRPTSPVFSTTAAILPCSTTTSASRIRRPGSIVTTRPPRRWIGRSGIRS